MKTLFELKKVSFTYAEEKKRALEDISMKIEEGGFYLLCGRSGCGKSTLLRQLKSTLTPKGKQEGEILYNGKELSGISDRVQCEEIGFVFQNPEDQIVTDHVWHELSFGLENLGYESREIHLRISEAASYLGLEKCFEKKVSELSGGQKQLLNLASVLVLRPKVLLFDEPFAQLDPLASQDFFHVLLRLHQEMGITVLLSEHELDEVFPYADKIFVMEKGRILAEGGREEIGTLLYKKNHELFLSMPVPLRISAECGESKHLPYTVAAGREWLEKRLRRYTDTSPQCAAQSNILQRNVSEEASGQNTLLQKISRQELRKEEAALEIKNVWFRYHIQEDYILRELSLSIKKGEIFALLGGNGTGKSTLLRVISGFLSEERGKIFFYGKRKKASERKRLFPHSLGFLPQEPEVLFIKDTVLEDISEVSDPDRVRKMAADMELSELLERHPYDLSRGEMQKAALTKVLLSGPEFLLLDEPTKGMDAFYKREFGKLLIKLKEEGKTVFFVSHDITFCAEYADRAGLYFRGNIHAVGDAKSFFSGNQFYTTAAHRMAGQYYPEAVTAEEVINEILSAD